MIMIVGMGGILIIKILDVGQEKLEGVKCLIFQLNVGEEGLCFWLVKYYFEIIYEEILEEDDYVYEIIVVILMFNLVVYN